MLKHTFLLILLWFPSLLVVWLFEKGEVAFVLLYAQSVFFSIWYAGHAFDKFYKIYGKSSAELSLLISLVVLIISSILLVNLSQIEECGAKSYALAIFQCIVYFSGVGLMNLYKKHKAEVEKKQ